MIVWIGLVPSFVYFLSTIYNRIFCFISFEVERSQAYDLTEFSRGVCYGEKEEKTRTNCECWG